jgi:hypothetical protein
MAFRLGYQAVGTEAPLFESANPRSGKAVINPCAALVIAARPTAGVASFILRDPFSAKNEATLAAFWLHQAAVYRAPKSFSLVESMKLFSDCAGRRRVSSLAPRTTLPTRPSLRPSRTVAPPGGVVAALICLSRESRRVGMGRVTLPTCNDFIPASSGIVLRESSVDMDAGGTRNLVRGLSGLRRCSLASRICLVSSKL